MSRGKDLSTLVRRPVGLALALGLAVAGWAQAADLRATLRDGWVKTHTHARDVSRAKYIGDVANNQPLTIAVALKLQNDELMDSYIDDLFRPGSPSYHQWMTSAQAAEYFAPTPAQAQAVADYLKQRGFSDVKIADNRLTITATASAAQAEQAFHTTLERFSRDGEEGIANVSDAEVPAALGSVVHAVLGLQTLDKMHTHSRPVTYADPQQGTTSNGGTYYWPDEFAEVYHTGGVGNATSTDVAIVGWGSMANSVKDLARFESDRKIAAVPTSVVTTGSKSTDESGEGEWAMDAQAIVGISGGVKSLTFYAAASGNDDLLLAALNKVVSDNKAKVVDLSWGSSEPNGGIGYFDEVFKTAIVQGQTFSASSGDNGSYPCATPTAKSACPAPGNGSYGDKSIVAVSYPASSPYVIAVGGTTLSTDKASGYLGENAWPYSGGGISKQEPIPSWQVGTVTGNFRGLPDVAFDADWDKSPIHYYITQAPVTIFGSVFYLPINDYTNNGGTSLASPLFVGAWARLQSAHGNSLGFAPPIIYANAKSGAAPWLHDVTSGSNGYYAGTKGWDNTTGWGSFDIEALNRAINIPSLR